MRVYAKIITTLSSRELYHFIANVRGVHQQLWSAHPRRRYSTDYTAWSPADVFVAPNSMRLTRLSRTLEENHPHTVVHLRPAQDSHSQSVHS
jgi:hypothetical protein